MSILTDEELACFGELFTPQSATSLEPHQAEKTQAYDEHYLSVSTEIPQVLTKILGQAQLTLLAEISHYRLWFPLVLKRDELGQFVPVLGVPEVLDARGSERSWRVNNLKGVKVMTRCCEAQAQVLSLSSSGLTIRLPENCCADDFYQANLLLPGSQPISVDFEPVRTENDIMAARINAHGHARQAIREFLFSEHKAQFSHLYAS
ncbi:hypothetical protein G3R49_03235 [Shewanella sp. WXL01]|uniref:PilZ domain-containing protein n=1 Tax=Shewanella maritima TaxID=2520507 RepID=A0A411PFS4_9GAMM|nr:MULTISPECIES: hypothetical protein [Shewanella]NKF49588.1 hypothetical protein [Shewanella sp. WXL01]QBF82314.1 hypothetical protein EXU30_06065 [Shewanella maritima]